MPSSSSVGAAVEMMRSTRAGSILISSSEGFGIITERDYLTKVAVYDEANPHDIPVTDIMTASPYVKASPLRLCACTWNYH
jgi:CBS domain-containing protein